MESGHNLYRFGTEGEYRTMSPETVDLLGGTKSGWIKQTKKQTEAYLANSQVKKSEVPANFGENQSTLGKDQLIEQITPTDTNLAHLTPQERDRNAAKEAMRTIAQLDRETFAEIAQELQNEQKASGQDQESDDENDEDDNNELSDNHSLDDSDDDQDSGSSDDETNNDADNEDSDDDEQDSSEQEDLINNKRIDEETGDVTESVNGQTAAIQKEFEDEQKGIKSGTDEAKLPVDVTKNPIAPSAKSKPDKTDNGTRQRGGAKSATLNDVVKNTTNTSKDGNQQ